MTITRICNNYEEHITRVMEKEIKKGHTVLDIGANIGHFTIIMAELVGREGKVFAFEPDPVSFETLKNNVEKYNYNNITLVQKAISNTNGKANLYIHDGDHRNNNLYCKYDRYIDVDIIRLDDYFNNYNGNIDFIKIDIQGAEVAALQGMCLTLQKSKNIKMVIEVWPTGLIKAGTCIDKLVQLLLKSQFQLFYTDRIGRMMIDTAEFSKGMFSFMDILCIKQAKDY